MPITNGTYQCNICEQPFKASSDDFYSCPCGESIIKPSDTGYSYKNGNRVRAIEGETYYLPEELVTLSEKEQAIYDEIKRIKAETGHKYYIHEFTFPGKNDETFLGKIIVNVDQYQSFYGSGTNTLQLTLNLQNNRYSSVSTNIEERLERFLTFMTQIEDKTLDLGKTGSMKQLAEEFTRR